MRTAAALLAVLIAGAARADPPALAARLRALDVTTLPADPPPGTMLATAARARLRAAAERENAAWARVRTRADWEAFRDARLRALKAALGPVPPAPNELTARVTGTRAGPGYRVENLVYETRPGLLVTANLYLPADPPKAMPAILIVHSHHHPRTQGELQDMGVTWARLGCAVLVPDQLGHGERRQHPFADAGSYPGPFKSGRQDYYSRYTVGLQLDVIGDSLMGRMVADLRRGIDLLWARPGVDRDRILLLGAVAGGGDPAAVTAALDPRVAAVAPFNFGGPQPDYPVPPDPARDFYWFGVPYWEPTRCLRRGAADGFAHWVIAAAVAPRRLLYAHEFGWDAPHDPAWPRLEKVFALYAAGDRLAIAAGKGRLRGEPPENTHCNNIGPYHRGQMYPALKRWFDLPAPKQEALDQRRPAADLAALTPAVVKELRPRPAHALAAETADRQIAAARRRLAALPPAERVGELRRDWARLLGDVAPPAARVTGRKTERLAEVTVERLVLEPEPGIRLPVVLLRPAGAARPPVVLGVAQDGKQAFLEQRADAIAALLGRGVAVCLPDLRGTGETRPGDGRRYDAAATTQSATEQLLGGTLLGARLRDLRTVLGALRGRPDLDATRVTLWGDSFAPPNPPDRRVAVPPDAADPPALAEPLGGTLALLGALYEDDVRAVYAHGGLGGFRALLDRPFVHVPHDALVPGAATAGDLGAVAAALAPRPVRLDGLVDGVNRRLPPAALDGPFAATRAAYRAAGAADRLNLAPGRPTAPEELARLLSPR